MVINQASATRSSQKQYLYSSNNIALINSSYNKQQTLLLISASIYLIKNYLFSSFQPNKQNDDIINIPIHVECVSEYQTYWLGCILAKDGLMLIFGAFLAWETRKVTVPALNDSKFIGKMFLFVFFVFLKHDTIQILFLLVRHSDQCCTHA